MTKCVFSKNFDNLELVHKSMTWTVRYMEIMLLTQWIGRHMDEWVSLGTKCFTFQTKVKPQSSIILERLILLGFVYEIDSIQSEYTANSSLLKVS